MAESQNGAQHQPGHVDEQVTWGPKLFIAVVAGVLLFFWWLLIYSGGVVLEH